MKVNRMPFLVTISRAIKFGTVAWLKNGKTDTILTRIKDVHSIYIKRGFYWKLSKQMDNLSPFVASFPK